MFSLVMILSFYLDIFHIFVVFLFFLFFLPFSPIFLLHLFFYRPFKKRNKKEKEKKTRRRFSRIGLSVENQRRVMRFSLAFLRPVSRKFVFSLSTSRTTNERQLR